MTDLPRFLLTPTGRVYRQKKKGARWVYVATHQDYWAMHDYMEHKLDKDPQWSPRGRIFRPEEARPLTEREEQLLRCMIF